MAVASVAVRAAEVAPSGSKPSGDVEVVLQLDVRNGLDETASTLCVCSPSRSRISARRTALAARALTTRNFHWYSVQLSETGTISPQNVAFTFDGGTMEEPGSISIQR